MIMLLPLDVLDLLCMQVANGSSAIIYLTDDEKYDHDHHEDDDEDDDYKDDDDDDDDDDESHHVRYGRSTASSQYFLQLAGYLGESIVLNIVFCILFMSL